MTSYSPVTTVENRSITSLHLYCGWRSLPSSFFFHFLYSLYITSQVRAGCPHVTAAAHCTEDGWWHRWKVHLYGSINTFLLCKSQKQGKGYLRNAGIKEKTTGKAGIQKIPKWLSCSLLNLCTSKKLWYSNLSHFSQIDVRSLCEEETWTALVKLKPGTLLYIYKKETVLGFYSAKWSK